MERPRRKIRPPGTLSDFLTAGEGERKVSIPTPGEGPTSKTHQREDETGTEGEDKGNEGATPGDTDKKLLQSQPYKCRECKARYRSKVALLRHAGKHNGEKPFECPECGKGLSSQSALSEHMNIHTNNKPHRCDVCGLESRQLSVHLRHLLTHQARPDHLYTCSICAKMFKQKEYLRRHMRKHTGQKPFACTVCEKRFTCKSELNRHSKRHSMERPHSCPECGQGFKMMHNLRSHLRSHAGTQQWKCLVCPAVFSKLKLLEVHRRSHPESIQHLHISRPDHHTLLVYAAGADRRRLPTLHPVTLPHSSTPDQPFTPDDTNTPDHTNSPSHRTIPNNPHTIDDHSQVLDDPPARENPHQVLDALTSPDHPTITDDPHQLSVSPSHAPSSPQLTLDQTSTNSNLTQVSAERVPRNIYHNSLNSDKIHLDHDVSLVGSKQALPNPTSENKSPSSRPLDQCSLETGIITDSRQSNINPLESSTALQNSASLSSHAISNLTSKTSSIATASLPHTIKNNTKLLRINNTTLPLDLILKSVGKGGAIKVKIIDRPPWESGGVSGGGCRRGGGESVVELVDADTHEKQEEATDKNQVDGDEIESLKIETSTEGDCAVETGVVEAAGVLGAGASIVSHCLAQHHYHRPDPSHQEYRDWLAALAAFCQQSEPPLHSEVCECLVTTCTALQKCLVQGCVPESTSPPPLPLPPGESPPKPCLDHHQYQFIHSHYLTVINALNRHFSCQATTSVSHH